MRRKTLFLIIYFMFGFSMIFGAYLAEVYPLEVAVGFLSRAMSAGNAEDMISYISQAYGLIPPTGNPVWILPTHRTDFNFIRRDIEGVVERLVSISKIPRETAAYAQTLNDVRGRLGVLVGQLYEAMPYLIFKPVNLAAAAAYLTTPFLVRRIVVKKRMVKVER